MIQCPYCGHRTFETDLHSHTRVRLTGLDDDDYREEEIDSYHRDWGTLECCQCGFRCDEGEAREAFEAGSGAVVDEDVYAWYEGLTGPLHHPHQPSRDAHNPFIEGLWAVACAWNFRVWQDERAAWRVMTLDTEKE